MESTNAAPAAPGLGAGAAITVVVILLIVAWIAIALNFMADTSLVGGFMFLWYWANIEQLQVSRLAPALAGSVVGIGIAWFLVYGATHYGGLGLGLALGLLILALFLDVVKAVPMFVNAATMLFVTLAAAPLIQLHVNWVELVVSTVAGGLFFAGAVWLLQKIAGRFASAS